MEIFGVNYGAKKYKPTMFCYTDLFQTQFALPLGSKGNNCFELIIITITSLYNQPIIHKMFVD